MKKLILISIGLALGIWIIFILYLTGIVSLPWLPSNIKLLELPKTTNDLGGSLSILEGLFSSIAVVLALVAVLYQGKELKKSTRAQSEQVNALTKQLEQQKEVIVLNAYSVRLQFLPSEIERLEKQISSLLKQVELETDPEVKSEKWEIIRNSRTLQTTYRDEAKSIDRKIKQLLPAT